MQSLIRYAENWRQSEPPYSEELLQSDPEDNYLRSAASNRSRTDVPFLVMQGGFLFVLIFFLAYCVSYGDIGRLTNGYDSCGNVCGKVNKFDLEFESDCRVEDMTKKPFLHMNGRRGGKCVERCPEGSIVIFGHRCIDGGNIHMNTIDDLQNTHINADDDLRNMDMNYLQNIHRNEVGSVRVQSVWARNVHTSSNDNLPFLNKVSRDLHTCTEEIIYMCLMALAMSFIILLILRYMAGVFVWTILFGVVLACALVTAYVWYLTGTESGFTPLAILFSIITLVVLLVILVMRKRIQLVIQLFKEAGKSIGAMPMLIFEPILTFVSLAAVWSAWVYFTLWIESAGIPVKDGSGVEFKKNGIMQFTRYYNHFVMIWMVQFVYGCQNMLIAGAVSTWYFTRNKARLGSPIYNSAHNMLKFHLGTISLGSLIIALIHIVRQLIRSINRTSKYMLYFCCLCCIYRRIDEGLTYLEQLMKYLTRNAYIVTSIHGYPFIESGTRAFKLLVENALRVLAINSVGDFVLILAKILVVAGTVILGVVLTKDKGHVEYNWAPVVIAAIVAYLIAHCFLTVYEMAIDTIFICFCEDCEINDGYSRPYFMSHELMEFVEKSKTVLGIRVIQQDIVGSPVVIQQPITANNPVIVSVTHNHNIN